MVSSFDVSSGMRLSVSLMSAPLNLACFVLRGPRVFGFSPSGLFIFLGGSTIFAKLLDRYITGVPGSVNVDCASRTLSVVPSTRREGLSNGSESVSPGLSRAGCVLTVHPGLCRALGLTERGDTALHADET